jgi:adhesin HecA-like repeat protein
VASNGQVKLKADTTNVVPSGARGRDSVRLESKTLFNSGLFIADVAHMPTGCGTPPRDVFYLHDGERGLT